MKKSFLLLALICIAIASCSKMERNEKKYLEGMQDEDYEASVNAVKEFCNWLETDKATMNYDFKLMREKIGLKAITSPDSVLRCYSWVSNRSEYGESYTNVAQWCIGESFIAYSGPIDYLLAGRKADIKHQETLAHSIDTIFEVKMANHPVYLIVQSYVNREGKRRAYVTSTHIPGVQLQIMPFFFDGTEMAGNNAFIDKGNTPVGELFKWDEKARKFYAYQVDDNEQLIPGKYTVYELCNERFTRLPDPE